MFDKYGEKLNQTMVGVYDAIRRVEQKMLQNAKLELSISEMDILEVVGKHRECFCSASTISKALRVTLPTVTVAVNRLVKKGYLEKTRSSEDGRMLSIVLTKRGRKADAVHRYFHEQAIRAMVKDLDEQGKAVLLQAMANLDRYLDQYI